MNALVTRIYENLCFWKAYTMGDETMTNDLVCKNENKNSHFCLRNFRSIDKNLMLNKDIPKPSENTLPDRQTCWEQ